jgi:hypothetical protein
LKMTADLLVTMRIDQPISQFQLYSNITIVKVSRVQY